MNYEYVNNTKIESYAKRIEKKNLKTKGISLSFSAIARRANCFVIEIMDKTVIIRNGWRNAMKEAKV